LYLGEGAILPVILCGGEGRRLAPLSTSAKPKQFHALAHHSLSLLQQTVLRVANKQHFAAPVIVGNVKHKGHIEEQLGSISCAPFKVFLEPAMRNTAPPILLSALYAKKIGYGHMLILPSDHYIGNIDIFVSDIVAASERGEMISYFGIEPDHPYSGYGYLMQTESAVLFHEKPERAKAEDLIKRGALWNSGIFLLKVPQFLQSAALTMPKLYNALLNEGLGAYKNLTSVSFDKAYCELTAEGQVLKANFDWTDLGSWASLSALKKIESAA